MKGWKLSSQTKAASQGCQQHPFKRHFAHNISVKREVCSHNHINLRNTSHKTCLIRVKAAVFWEPPVQINSSSSVVTDHIHSCCGPALPVSAYNGDMANGPVVINLLSGLFWPYENTAEKKDTKMETLNFRN